MGVVTDLSPFTYYNCSVFAVTDFGGPQSPSLSVRTAEAGMECDLIIYICKHILLRTSLTVPSAPVITSVTAIDSFSVQVIWSAPIDPNGVISGYTITYNVGEIFNAINVLFNGETVSTIKQIYMYVLVLY